MRSVTTKTEALDLLRHILNFFMLNIKSVTLVFIIKDLEILSRYNEVKTLSNHGKVKATANYFTILIRRSISNL